MKWTKKLPIKPGLYLRVNPPISAIAHNYIVEIDGKLKVLGVSGANMFCNPTVEEWAGHKQFWWFGPIPPAPKVRTKGKITK